MATDDDRSSRLRELFNLALDRPATQRSTFLDQACADDAALRAEVSSLLAAWEEADSFLETPAKIPGRPSAEDDSAARLIGQTVGRYRIQRLIAAGGMGVVYQALQDQPQRIAAVKVIRAGIAARPTLRRFAHEAEILGRLRHPGIAQIYEAGTCDVGGGRVPYFAMEYIPQPQTIVQYAAACKLTPRQRLELFARVCDAVQHAHQHGVIHRDLKPGNILVDHSGQPKVVDFGVARATDADLQTTTLQTDTGQLLGTIPYMSPEQVMGDPQQLDTRSDVYSLGVVCYELLTGRLPYEVRGRSIPEAVRVIREVEPRPLGAVERSLRGDVETIVGKALEKERQQRYQSASDLAADIRRYLNDEPIVAHPPSRTYVLRKFARRNKVLVGAVAAVFVALAAGIVGVSIELARAVAAEQLAEKRRIESEEITQFLISMLASSSPDQAGRPLLSKDTLERTSAAIGERLAGRPLVEAKLRFTIGVIFMDLGHYELAEEQLERALRIGRRELTEEHQDTLTYMDGLAALHFRRGRHDRALPLVEQAVEISGRLLGEEDPNTLNYMCSLGDLYRRQGRYDQAQALLERAVEISQRVLGEDHPGTVGPMFALGTLHNSRGRYGKAESYYQRVLELLRRELGAEHPETMSAMASLAGAYADQNRHDGAAALYERVLEFRRRTLGEEHPDTLTAMNNLALVYDGQGRYELAEPLYAQALEIQRRTLGDEHPDTLTSANNLATLYRQQDRHAEAESLLQQTLDISRRVYGQEHPDTLTFMSNLALVYESQGRDHQAETLWRQALELRRRVLGATHPSTLGSMNDLARIYDRQGRHDQAELLLASAVAAARGNLPDGLRQTGVLLCSQGRCLTNLGRYEEAEAALLEAYDVLVATLGEAHRQTRAALRLLSELYAAWDKPEQAAEYRARLAAP